MKLKSVDLVLFSLIKKFSVFRCSSRFLTLHWHSLFFWSDGLIVIVDETKLDNFLYDYMQTEIQDIYQFLIYELRVKRQKKLKLRRTGG